MPGKYDQTTPGQANPPGTKPQQAETQGAAQINNQLVTLLTQIASTLQAQNKMLELIQGNLQTARSPAPANPAFQPGSDAQKAADVFNGVVARLNFSAPPPPTAPGKSGLK